MEATPASERGLESADERLRALLARIGVQSNHYGTLAGGQLRQVEDLRQVLTDELERARRGRAESPDALAAQQAERSTELAHLVTDETALQQARLRAAAQELGEAQAEAGRLDRAVREVVDRPPLPTDLQGRAAAAREALRTARETQEVARIDVANTRSALEPLHQRRCDADAAVEALAAYAAVSTDREEQVRSALGNLVGAAPVAESAGRAAAARSGS